MNAKQKVDYAKEIDRIMLAAADAQSRGTPPAIFYRAKARRERRPLIRKLLNRLADLGQGAGLATSVYVEESIRHELGGGGQ